MVRNTCLAILLAVWPLQAVSQQLALFNDSRAAPLFARPSAGAALEREQTASLFSGPAGLFDRIEGRAPPAPVPSSQGSRVAQLRDLIAKAEAGPKGYDAVQHGARIRPAKPPTEMSLGEIFAWIRATPGQPHAIGRYQFIPATLRHLVKTLDLPATARFDTALQDRLADVLLEQAGLTDFLDGRTDRVAFMNAIARVWAGLPNSSGKSHYHGYAGNKAVLSWAYFEAEMARIFPLLG